MVVCWDIFGASVMGSDGSRLERCQEANHVGSSQIGVPVAEPPTRRQPCKKTTKKAAPSEKDPNLENYLSACQFGSMAHRPPVQELGSFTAALCKLH